MSKTPQEWLEKINDERKKGNVCFMTLEGLASQSLENIVQQPAEGILYDLNRLPEVVATWIESDKKWVNDYAVGDVITYLKNQNDAMRAKLNDAISGLEELIAEVDYMDDERYSGLVRKLKGQNDA